MKNLTTSVVLLAAALCVSASTPLSADSKNQSPRGFSVRTLNVTPYVGEQIERGATRAYVARVMSGQSRQELTSDVWVYSGYHAELDAANEQGCGTMIITFANDKVVDLKLVNKRAVAVIAAKLNLSPAAKNIASKK